MKKKLVLLSALAVLALATLTGCCKHEWADATCKAPKTCSLCGKTEGEVVDHTWTDATCEAPKTCSVCGETEGEALGHQFSEAGYMTPGVCSVCGAEGDVKPNYFEEKGMELLDYVPETFEAPYMIFDQDNRENYKLKTANRTMNVEVTDGENDTKIITLTTTIPLTIEYDEITGEGLYYGMYSDGLCDKYTGVWINGKTTNGDDSFTNSQIINIDGKDYEISYEDSITWEDTGWYMMSDTVQGLDMTAVKVLTITVPKDYDGLCYGTKQHTKNTTQEQADEDMAKGIDDEITYVDDNGDYGELETNGIFIQLIK